MANRIRDGHGSSGSFLSGTIRSNTTITKIRMDGSIRRPMGNNLGTHATNNYNFIKSRRTGKRWLTAVIEKLRDLAWDLWEHRNKIQLEVKERERNTSNRLTISIEFRKGYYELERRDYHLFQKRDINLLFMEHPDKQDAWLNRVQGARRRAQHRLTSRSLRAQRSILRNWLNSAG